MNIYICTHCRMIILPRNALKKRAFFFYYRFALIFLSKTFCTIVVNTFGRIRSFLPNEIVRSASSNEIGYRYCFWLLSKRIYIYANIVGVCKINKKIHLRSVFRSVAVYRRYQRINRVGFLSFASLPNVDISFFPRKTRFCVAIRLSEQSAPSLDCKTRYYTVMYVRRRTLQTRLFHRKEK